MPLTICFILFFGCVHSFFIVYRFYHFIYYGLSITIQLLLFLVLPDNIDEHALVSVVQLG